MKKSGIVVFFSLAFTITISAQEENLGTLDIAQKLFEAGKYESVLNLLKNTQLPEAKIKEGMLLRALVYYKINDLNQSEIILKSLIEDESAAFAEVWLYLGRVSHHKYDFDQATEYYKAYLKNIPQNHRNRKMVWEEIRKCANGRIQQYNENSIFIENFGNNVNTQHDEFNPVESPSNEGTIYFSTLRAENTGGKRNLEGLKDDLTGQLYSDMYRSSNERGTWESPNPMHFVLNSPLHEIFLNFDSKGDVFYYFRGTDYNTGAVFKSNFNQSGLVPQEGIELEINSPINPAEGGFFVFKENVVLFSAILPEGYGGWDIYISTKTGNKWSKPQNLGSQINTEFDEVYPYLTPDESLLFYSSNNSEYSVGGYDILRSEYNLQKGHWSSPESLGFPINSPGDDVQFKIAKDGYTAYFASSRKESKGLRDLYAAYFTEQINMQQSSLWIDKVDPVVVEVPKLKEEKKQPSLITQEIKPHSNQPVPMAEVPPTEVKQPITSPDVPPTEIKKSISAPEEKLAPFLMVSLTPFILSNEDIRWMDEYVKRVKSSPFRKIIIDLGVKVKTPQFDKYQETLKYSQDIISLLLGKGLKEEQIKLRIFSKSEIADNKIEVTLKIVDMEGMPLNLTPGKDPFSLNSVEQVPFYYKISLQESSELKFAALINNHLYPVVEKSGANNPLIYSVGKFKSFEEARIYADRLIKNGLKEINIRPYIYDASVPVDIVRQFTHIFPDFKNYLQQ